MSDTGNNYDVVVVGGGTGGTPAAIAAARNGAKVLLIEKNGFLGGLATGGLINPWPHWLARHSWVDSKDAYIKGIYTEVLDRLHELGSLGKDGRSYDEEVMKIVLEEMCLEANIKLLYHSFLFRVHSEGRRVRAVEVANKSGVSCIGAKYFVDGTGDADLAALAGAQWEKGRAEDGGMQPMSLTFRLGGVNMEKLPEYSPSIYLLGLYWTEPPQMPEEAQAMHKAYLEAQRRGEIKNPRGELLYFKHLRNGIVHFNTTRIQGLDATNAQDRTKAEIEGRRQVLETLKFLRRFPAFENAYLVSVANEIGVRESRRIVGEYVLTAEDILNGRKFEDGVARGHAPVDIHHPKGADSTMVYCKDYVSHDIPYRCLVPKDFDNMLIGSHCISTTHQAHASIRMIPQVFAIGEAAGTAAALASKQGTACRDLETGLLRRTLKEQGASIWEPGMLG